MSHAGSEEERARKSKAIFNCSMAIREAIQAYGFAATLDLIVRISNHDPVVSELLPYLPSIANAIMLEDWSLTLGSRSGEEKP
jgi:hypothetical protein